MGAAGAAGVTGVTGAAGAAGAAGVTGAGAGAGAGAGGAKDISHLIKSDFDNISKYTYQEQRQLQQQGQRPQIR